MLFDFDFSLMFPRTTIQRETRLPAGYSFEITSNLYPPDTMQGELDYNPFIFEMGCLGIYLCGLFQVCYLLYYNVVDASQSDIISSNAPSTSHFWLLSLTSSLPAI